MVKCTALAKNELIHNLIHKFNYLVSIIQFNKYFQFAIK